ncbi:MAG: hypothetical protein M3440_03415 [Chloroflexota bacterium]|nr:hypothetical protein [Chloroflexota bacterium]
MARRRYISTSISVDKAINQLAIDGGDFAVMLYTWMVPHAGDDGRLTGDPDEILMTVIPGRRDKDAGDVERALIAMTAVGLIAWCDKYVTFPCESFYKHQSYIKQENRRSPAETPNTSNRSDDHCATPENAGERRKSAENAVSFPSSFPVSLSPSVSPSEESADAPPSRPSEAAMEVAETLVTAPWVNDELVDVAREVDRLFGKVPHFSARDGPALAEMYVNWRGYRKKPPENWSIAWLRWTKKEASDEQQDQPRQTGGTASASRNGAADLPGGTDYDSAFVNRIGRPASGARSHSGPA